MISKITSLFFLSLFSINIYAQDNNLIAYYPFNGNANDESGNGNKGKVFKASPTLDRFGKSDNAYFFNGSSGYINIGSEVFTRKIQDFSYALWVKTDYSGHINTLLSKRHDGDGSWYTLTIENNKPQIMLDGAGWFYVVSSSTAINDNQWHFVVATKESSKYSLYVDGALEGQGYDSRGVDSYDSPMHIGHHGAWNNYFNGSIDDVRIYDKALSMSDIQSLWNDYTVGIKSSDKVAWVDNTASKETKSVIKSSPYSNIEPNIQKTPIEKGKVFKSKSISVYKDEVLHRNIGGTICYEFLKPGLFENGQLKKITNADIDQWVNQIRETRKIQSYRPTWGGEITISKSELDVKDLIKSSYIAVPIYKSLQYFPEEYQVSKNRNDNYYTIDRLVLFPEVGQSQFQYQNLYDLDFFYYAFPNASNEKINNLISTGMSNGILKKNLDWSIDKILELYPNSSYAISKKESKKNIDRNKKEFKNYITCVYNLCDKNYQKDIDRTAFNETSFFTVIDGDTKIDKVVVSYNNIQKIYTTIDVKLIQNDASKMFFSGNCTDKDNNNLKYQIVKYKEENYWIFVIQSATNSACNTVYLGSEDKNNNVSINPFQHFIEEDKYKATEFLLDNAIGFFKPAKNYGLSNSNSSSQSSSSSDDNSSTLSSNEIEPKINGCEEAESMNIPIGDLMKNSEESNRTESMTTYGTKVEGSWATYWYDARKGKNTYYISCGLHEHHYKSLESCLRALFIYKKTDGCITKKDEK